MISLPKSECEYGYSNTELKSIFIPRNEYFTFCNWIYGQTGTICETHGPVIYHDDVERFLKNLPAQD